MVVLADVPLSRLLAAYAAAVAVFALRGIALAPAGRRLAALGPVALFSLFPFVWWFGYQDIRPTLVWATTFPAVIFIGTIGHGGHLRRHFALPAEERPTGAGPREWAIALQVTAAVVVFILCVEHLLADFSFPSRSGGG
ncbi:hypothetical protein [Nocardiopsis potens]|uniref:hypothetical protein n=1 Tax=Nocardiopsis potens TaxID=1246458 RepID=UPI00034530E2|nr:hypothetical protein [Nocardiopsis potens]